MRVAAHALYRIYKLVNSESVGRKSTLALNCFLQNFSPNAERALIQAEQNACVARQFASIILKKCDNVKQLYPRGGRNYEVGDVYTTEFTDRLRKISNVSLINMSQ